MKLTLLNFVKLNSLDFSFVTTKPKYKASFVLSFDTKYERIYEVLRIYEVNFLSLP